MKRFVPLVAVLVLLSACTDNSSGSPVTIPSSGTSAATPTSGDVAPTTVPPTTSPGTTSPGATPPGTTPPDTSAPATTLVPTTVPGTATTTTVTTTTLTTTTGPSPSTTELACPAVGDTNEKLSDGFPGRLSSLVGVDIRTGGHRCFERVVIELAPSDIPIGYRMPGWWVRYQDDPIMLGETDDLFVDLRGDANLLITMESWMPSMGGQGYDGPTDIAPTNVVNILQLYQTNNFEALSTWAVGLDRVRPFTVFTLSDPPRLVVDIQR